MVGVVGGDDAVGLQRIADAPACRWPASRAPAPADAPPRPAAGCRAASGRSRRDAGRSCRSSSSRPNRPMPARCSACRPNISVRKPRSPAAASVEPGAQLVGQLAPRRGRSGSRAGSRSRAAAAGARPRIQTCHLPSPLRQRLAPDRVARHHTAVAERETAGASSACSNRVGELDEPGVDLAVPLVRVVGQHEAMVLVGKQQALAAPARAHDDAREGNRRRPPALGRQLGLEQTQHAAVESLLMSAISAWISGAGTPSASSRSASPTCAALTSPRPVHAVLVGQPVDVVDHRSGRDRQRLVQLEHADDGARPVDHRHVTQSVPAHEADGAVELVVGADGEHGRGHDRGDRLVAASEAADHVLLGDDAAERGLSRRSQRRRRPAPPPCGRLPPPHWPWETTAIGGGAMWSRTRRRNTAVCDEVMEILFGRLPSNAPAGRPASCA